MNRQRGEVAVAETLADLDRCRGGGRRALQVTAQLVLKRNREEHVPLLDALTFVTLEHTLSAPEPTACRAELAA